MKHEVIKNGKILLLTGAEQVITMRGLRPKRGKEQKEIGILDNASIAIRDGKILAVGSDTQVKRALPHSPDEVWNVRGKVICPGFVDAHTHLIFAGTREKEFHFRREGAKYEEILKGGGGIHSTVTATRKASTETIIQQAMHYLSIMLEHGTTSVEIKSGYGLSLNTEIHLLQCIQKLKKQVPQELMTTFLGAHTIPQEYQNRRKEYIHLVIYEMLPKIRERNLADFVDVFCDKGAFTLKESQEILRAAKKFGFGLKIHGEEIIHTGASVTAARLGATSVDHLVHLKPEEIPRLAETSTVAVLLPCTAFSLMKNLYPPARQLIEGNVPVAIATDFNPGTSFCPSMQMAILLSIVEMKMTPEEALCAATVNAACAAGFLHAGSILQSQKANLLVLKIPNIQFLGYYQGINLVEQVILGNEIWTNP